MLTALKSHAYENQGNYQAAAELLRDLIAEGERYQCPELYSNLAVLEDLAGNKTQSQHYFEKAVDSIGEAYRCHVSPIVYHNLIHFAAREMNVDAAKSWLSRYRDNIDRNNVIQYLSYLNEQIELARQLQDLPLLLEAYALIDIEIIPKATRSERLALYVTGLRMRVNDPLPIAEHLAKIDLMFSELICQRFPKNYTALKELFNFFSLLTDQGVVKRIPPQLAATVQRLFRESRRAMEEMPEKIREYRHTIPEALVGESLHWLEELHYLSRILIGRSGNRGNGFFRIHLDELIEQKNKGSEVENLQIQLRACMMICEWYLDSRDFLCATTRQEAISICRDVLHEAQGLLRQHTGNTHYADFFIGQAFFELQINESVQQSAVWIKHFDDLECSLDHFARWLREQYTTVKAATQDA
ncbi:hypothetical protein ABC977_16895 [Thioalkalicoccus limnaeus]|uniref:Tetratricopeptide repeat protein n=1 Tax=Thioalkalicoccus limnaeus TaxID=120681 RepID=A0ABV4BLB0_9GAMM